MKKIGQLYRESFQNQVKNNLDKITSLFIFHYSGVSSGNLTNLRKNLTKDKAKLFIVKNSLTKRVLADLNYKDLNKMIEGPTAFVFGYDDPALISKTIINFSKENEKLVLEGGLLADKLIDKETLKRLASLPSREVLIAKVIGQMKAPLSGLARVLNNNLQKLVLVLNQIKNKKN